MGAVTELDLAAISSLLVNPSSLYDALAAGGAGGIFRPDGGDTTLEEMNGGLELANYGGGAGTIPAWAFSIGAFCRLYYMPFDREHYVYARQGSIDQDVDDEGKLRIIHAGLSTTVFQPWQAKATLFGVQALCRGDATKWSKTGTPKYEHWDFRVKVNGSVKPSLYWRIPYGRTSSVAPDAAGATTTPDAQDEMRNRWVSKLSLGQNLTKGRQTLQVDVAGKIYSTDQKTAKAATPTGAMLILALR